MSILRKAAAGAPQFQLLTIDDATVFSTETVETLSGPMVVPVLVLTEDPTAEVIKLTNNVTYAHPQAGDAFDNFAPVLKRSKLAKADIYYSAVNYASNVPLYLWVHDGAGASAPVDVHGPYVVPLDSEYEEVRTFADDLGECKLVGGINKFPTSASTKGKDSFQSVTCTAGEVLFDNLMRGPNASYLADGLFLLAKADGDTTLKATVYNRAGAALASVEADFQGSSADWAPTAFRPDEGWTSFVALISGTPYAQFGSRFSIKVEILSTTATTVRGGVFYGGGETSAFFDA